MFSIDFSETLSPIIVPCRHQDCPAVGLPIPQCSFEMSLRLFVFVFLIFFFSSRRRHTRYIGDWSSDVCSSDLPSARRQHGQRAHRDPRVTRYPRAEGGAASRRPTARIAGGPRPGSPRAWARSRSEERRVGKESR